MNPANNQIVGQTYDAANRLTQNGVSVQYSYDSQNKRVWAGTLDSGSLTSQAANLYGIDGQKLGTYSLSASSAGFTDSATSLSVYFGHKRVAIIAGGLSTPYVQDRLGSNMSWAIDPVSLYPWGEDRGTPAPDDQIKFATYTRDSATLLDYADQRYYSNQSGRFMTPDPAGQAAANPRNPVTWNLYTYVGDDPVNSNDPSGLFGCAIDDPSCDPLSPDPDDDDDDDGGGNPCVASDGFTPVPGPFCQVGGVPQPTAPPKPTITCDLQLFSQPAGSSLDPFDHTYAGLITEINGVPLPETHYEAGPVSKTTGQSIGSSSNAWLNSLDGPSHTSHSYSTSSGLVWQTGFSSAECPVNAAVAADNGKYPQNKVTYGLPSPDSNSFTYSLLTMSGVSIPWWVNQLLGSALLGPVPGIPLAPGWGTVIQW